MFFIERLRGGSDLIMSIATEYIELLLRTIPGSIYIAFICAGIVSSFLAIYVKGLKEGVKTSSLFLLIIYAAIVICTTVVFRISEENERGIRLDPFWSYTAISEGGQRLLVENVMNVAAFIPIGMFLAIGLNKLKWWQVVLFGFGFSVVIEFMQFYFDRGLCETDDIIHNTLGCIIGFLIIKFVLWSYRKLHSQDHTENNGSNGLSIFEIQQSKQAREFVLKNGSLEFEVFAEILKQSKNIPYVSGLFKLGKVAVNLMDYWYVRKLQLFLDESESLDEEKKNKFLNGLSQKDYKRISRYLTQLLYSTDEEGKARLMGKIYRSRLLDEIDNEMMLRLCSVVNKAFLADLDHLEQYVEVNDSDDFVTDNLNALGLLQDKGNMYETHDEADEWDSTGWGPTKHQLNVVGRELLRIKES